MFVVAAQTLRVEQTVPTEVGSVTAAATFDESNYGVTRTLHWHMVAEGGGKSCIAINRPVWRGVTSSSSNLKKKK